MKVHILSDLHVEFAPFDPPALDADVVVLAGDVHSPGRRGVEWAQAQFAGKRVLYIPGNHEFYDRRFDEALSDARAAAQGSNVHLLDGDEIVIEGVRFLGATLWTDFELSIDTPTGRRSDARLAMAKATNLLADYALIRVAEPSAEKGTSRELYGRKLAAADTQQIHATQRAWLGRKLAEPFDGPTVVATHYPPNRGSLAPRYSTDWVSGAFVNDLPDDFFEVPALWIHGHTHDSFDYQVGRCRVICNPRGYVNPSGRIENRAFNPSFAIDLPGPDAPA